MCRSEKGQWYRIAFQARAEQLASNSVNMTVTNMANWQSLFEYQRFEPGPEWQRFSFEVQANDTAEQQDAVPDLVQRRRAVVDRRRADRSHRGPGPRPMARGLYLDVPDEWDDPYRFFRW